MKRQMDSTAEAIVIAAGLLAWASVVIAAMVWVPTAVLPLIIVSTLALIVLLG